MKKIITLLVIICITVIAIIIFSDFYYPTGAPAGVSSSPSDGATCAKSGCHGGPVTAMSGIITSNVPVAGYTGGITYTITATFSGSAGVNKGFEISPQNSAGTLLGTLIAGTGTKLTGSGKYITHSTPISADPAVWSFQWTAPAKGTGTVTFYGSFAFDFTNVYTSFLIINEAPPAVPPNATTNAATNLSCIGGIATLNGTVNPNNASTTVTFEYGITNSYGTTVTAAQSPVSGSAEVPVSASLSGLSPDITYHFRVVASNTNGSANGSDMTFSIGNTPLITLQPQNQIACLNQPQVCFNVSATGTEPLSYLWYPNDDAELGNINTNSAYCFPIDDPLDAGTYNVIVSNSCGIVTSDGATLTVNLPPAFLSEPLGSEVCIGDSVTSLVVSASGTAPLHYQWYVNGAPSGPGDTLPNYVSSPVMATDAGNYYMVVTNSCSKATSNTVTLTVDSTFTVNVVPQTITKYVNDSITFSVNPAGATHIFYQWKKNNVNILNATTAKYKIKPIALADSGVYSVNLFNACKNITVVTNTLMVKDTNTFSLSGHVEYDNNSLTPITNTRLLLKLENKIIDSTLTDKAGAYSFIHLRAGSYTITPVIKKLWGGVNPIDALIIIRDYLGLFKFTDNLKQAAADVNLDTHVNPIDALLVNRRYLKLINHFTAPDWLYTSTAINLMTNTIYDISVVCSGDVNGSYNPPLRVEFTNLPEDGIMNVKPGQTVDVPFIFSDNQELGALGLLIKCNSSDIKVLDVLSDINGLLYNITDDNVNIAWNANDKPLIMKEGDRFIYLRCLIGNMASDLENIFSLSSESVLADNNLNLIDPSVIHIPLLKMLPANNSDFSFSSYPNPFNNSATINYNLPESTEVIIYLTDVLGNQIRTIVKGNMNTGLNTVIFDAAGLSNGVYFYNIIAGSHIAKGKLILVK